MAEWKDYRRMGNLLGPATAIMPVAAFPCEISEGKLFYIVKLHEEQDAVIVCAEKKDEPIRERTD